MNDQQLIEALRSTRRVDDATIATGTDRRALASLRDGIPMSDRHTAPAVEMPRRGRRLGRRGLTAGTLGLVLVGGGAAYAVAQLDRGPTLDGLNCAESMTVSAGGDVELTRSADGRPASGDDVADCAHIRAVAGMPPLVDPYAFTYQRTRFVVARAGVPAEVMASASASPPSSGRAAVLELEAAMTDWVEGPARLCLSADEAQAYAQATLDRLHLTGWTIRTSTLPATPHSGPCAVLTTRPDLERVDLAVNASTPVELPSDAVARKVYTTAEELAEKVASRCLALPEAEAVAETVVGDQGSVSPVPDETASCTRVDMEVGGSVFVTLHGPGAARP